MFARVLNIVSKNAYSNIVQPNSIYEKWLIAHAVAGGCCGAGIVVNGIIDRGDIREAPIAPLAVVCGAGTGILIGIVPIVTPVLFLSMAINGRRPRW